jgi:hypothetical protein
MVVGGYHYRGSDVVEVDSFRCVNAGEV